MLIIILIHSENITTNIFRIQEIDSIMCRCFCFGFFDSMLKVKSLLEYTNYFLLINVKRMAK